MSQTLNFVSELLVRARRLQTVGRPQDALPILLRLAALPELDNAVVAEVHNRLADIRMARGQYRKARRHLSLVLALNASDPRTHFRLGQAYDRDIKAEDRLALRHYRQSLHLCPDQADCLAALGQLVLRMDRASEGIEALRRAAELQSDDPTILAALVDAFCQEGRWEEAESSARLARFRGPVDARFQAVWDDFCFARTASEQSVDTEESESAVLPFAGEQPAISVREMHGRRWRLDGVAGHAPHLPRVASRPDSRRAP